MRTPATFSDFAARAASAFARGQAAVLCLLGLYFLLARVVDAGGSSRYYTAGPPGWYVPLAGVVALLTVAAVLAQWLRGDLDTFQVRRRLQPPPAEG